MLSLIWPWPVPKVRGDEDALITEMGMSYLHIPVDFANPTLEDAQIFFTMRGLKTQVWVHYQVNARVSAFLYLYQRCELVLDEDATGPILKADAPDG